MTGVERVVRALPGVSKVDVRVVWDPPWHPGMMADSVRKALGR